MSILITKRISPKDMATPPNYREIISINKDEKPSPIITI